MSLISWLIVSVVFGFLLWLATTYIPMPAIVKRVILVVAVVVWLIWTLQGFGLLAGINNIRIGG
jgi:hypothetical protein